MRYIKFAFLLPLLVLVALPLLPDAALAWGAQWISYTYGNWSFDVRSHAWKWQEVVYRSYHRIDTVSSRIRLYNSDNGNHSSFPLAFDSECTPDQGPPCNYDGDYIGQNGNLADPSPMPARDYYNNHDESWSWYRNVDWLIDTRFYGECSGCSGLGNNFLYANDRNSSSMFAVGIHGTSNRGFFFTFNNGSAAYLGWRDGNWHTARVVRIWNTWQRWFDGGYYASAGASAPNVDQRGWRIPTNLNVGNLQQISGVWVGVNNDYVSIYYALPDASINSLSHTSPQPYDTSITVNTWAGDIRGAGTVAYYGNWANNGSATGAWWNFAAANGAGNGSYNSSGWLNCGAAPGFCNGTHLLAVNTYDVYGNLRQQWDVARLNMAGAYNMQTTFQWVAPPPTATPTRTPTPTSTPTRTPTATSTSTPIPNSNWTVNVQVRCPDGSAASTSVADPYRRFYYGFRSITPSTWFDSDRFYTDGTLSANVPYVGYSDPYFYTNWDPEPSTGQTGMTMRRLRSWPSGVPGVYTDATNYRVYFTPGVTPNGTYTIEWEISEPTPQSFLCPPPPTATPTPTDTPTPGSTPVIVIETPAITPVGYIDTVNTPLDPSSNPVGPGTPTPVPAGLSNSGFYYPLQVWLNLVPSVVVETPARYCVNSTCYDAATKPVDYTYVGMEREDGLLVATTPYSQTFNTSPYSFNPSQYLKLFWEFPNIDDGSGLNPPDYYYINQKPGQVKFHYRVTLESTWSAAQTASWPASPAPPGPWGGPGTPYVQRQEVELSPGTGLYLWMYLTRPVIEHEQ